MKRRVVQSAQTGLQSAKGAPYTSMGRSPMKTREEKTRAEGPVDRATPAHPLDIGPCGVCAGANWIIISEYFICHSERSKESPHWPLLLPVPAVVCSCCCLFLLSS